jgi:uncharacterized membrane protein HdeD (DUF308 family)
MTADTNNLEMRTVVQAGRDASRSSVLYGLMLVTLGVFSVMAPLFAGLTIALLVGFLLVLAGCVQLYFSFQSDTFGQGALKFLVGGVTVAAGVVMVAQPGQGLGALTILLMVYFVVAGITEIALGFKAKPAEGWGWMAFTGALSILLGFFLYSEWPVSGIWAVGLLVGIRLMFQGFTLISLGNTGKEALKHFEDFRLDELESHVRANAETLQEVQVAQAVIAVGLRAVASELGTKVSAGDVDPAISAVNEQMKEARGKMEKAAGESKEAWSAAQKDAQAAFEDLRKRASKVTDQLIDELGLDDMK